MQRLLLVVFVIGFLKANAFAQPFNVKAYGAVPNDGIDDGGAFVAAVNAIPASGGELYIPGGTYDLFGYLPITNKQISIRGEGQRVSRVLWRTGSDGIVFTDTTGAGYTLTISSVSLLTTANGTGTAVRGVWPAYQQLPGQYRFLTAQIYDIHIGGEPQSQAWNFGIWLTNAPNSKISSFMIHGAFNSGTAAIQLDANSTATFITQGNIFGMREGIRVHDITEGTDISHVEIVSADFGIVFNTQAFFGLGSPGSSVSNCHTNTRLRGIYVADHSQIAITDNLIYKLGTANWIGIHLRGASLNRVIGNYIITADTSPTHNSNGIVVEGTTNNSFNNVIQGNITRFMDTGIWLVGAAATENLVTGNINKLYRVFPVYDTGLGNLVSNNLQ